MAENPKFSEFNENYRRRIALFEENAKKELDPKELLQIMEAVRKLKVVMQRSNRNITKQEEEVRVCGDEVLKKTTKEESSKKEVKKIQVKEESKTTTEKKRKKVIKHSELLFEPAPEMPIEFRNRIYSTNGQDIKLVIQKEIFETDLKRHHNRFTIPLRQVRSEFLTKEEEMKLEEGGGADEEGEKTTKKKKAEIGDVELIIDPSSEKSETVCLRKWNINSAAYVLTKTWNSVVENNGDVIRKNAKVQLWSFRRDEKLCFAMVKVKDGNDGAGNSDDGGADIQSSNKRRRIKKIIFEVN